MEYRMEYKVRFEGIDGKVCVSDWDTLAGARRKFEALKNEKVHVTVWAELCFASLVENDLDEVWVIDSFERRIIEVMNKRVLV